MTRTILLMTIARTRYLIQPALAFAQEACDINGSSQSAASGSESFVCGSGFVDLGGDASTAIGQNNIHTGFAGTSVGAPVATWGNQGGDSLILPYNPLPVEAGSTAVGSYSFAIGDGNVAIGDGTGVGIFSVPALGLAEIFTVVDGTAVGSQSHVSADGAEIFTVVDGTAVGSQSHVSADGGTAFGSNSGVAGVNAVAIGFGARSDFANSVNIGTGNDVQSVSAVAIGTGQFASGIGAVAIGDPNYAIGKGAVALGADNTATGDGAVAVGNMSTAIGEGSVALGSASQATAEGNVAIGDAASATGAGSVAIGAGAMADQANTVSVGRTGLERRIVNVAPGITATDAVNLGQLNAAVANLSTSITTIQFDLKKLSRIRQAGDARNAALAGMPQVITPGRGMIATSMGGSGSAIAFAVGASKSFNDDHTLVKAAASFATRTKEVTWNLGAGYEF